MKRYFIYLDESGDFDTDLNAKSWKNPSLVGGFFGKNNSVINLSELERKIKTLTGKDNHATELDSENKGQKVFNLLTGVSTYPIEFVIFQNDRKKKIVNSTKTYLTMLAEGLIQLIKKLVIEENEPVELRAVIGFKKDTTQIVTSSMFSGYIDKKAYEEELAEKIALERAKLQNPQFQNSVIHIELADDKRNTFLELCDYICNFWYTSGANAFSGDADLKGQIVPIRATLKGLYKKDYVFPLFSTEENEHVIRLLQDGFYADALFEVVAESISEENCRRIVTSFTTLTPKQMHRQLDNLADYIGDLIMFRDNDHLVKQVLDGAQKLYQILKEKNIDDLKFYLDIELYMLTYYSHYNDLASMEMMLPKLEKDVIRYTRQTLDNKYLLIYFIRKAVYLCSVGRYKECCEVCEEMELLVEMTKEAITSNDLFIENKDIRSEQLGKILGTKLQAQIRLCYQGQETYNNAKEVSERAIKQFEYAYDMKIQYQYRAELEAVCGNQDDAICWLQKSFGNVPWRLHLSSNKRTNYDIYNLLFVAAMSKRQDPSFSVEIADAIYKSTLSEIEKDEKMAKECLFLMGYSMIGDKRLDGRGKALLRKISENHPVEKSRAVLSATAELNGANGLDAFMS